MLTTLLYILIGIPLALFIYLPYVSFLKLNATQYITLLLASYVILCLLNTLDKRFRQNFILVLCNVVSSVGRVILYIFVAIVLITGPSLDIQKNILQMIQNPKREKYPEEKKLNEFRHSLYHLLDSHVGDQLLRSTQPLCKVADDWIKYNSGNKSNICGSNLLRMHKIVTSTNEYESFLNDYFHYAAYYTAQRILLMILFILCSYHLFSISHRYRLDTSFKNDYVTSTLSRLDGENLKPTESTRVVDKDVELIESSVAVEDQSTNADEQRVFNKTLPLTSLEQKTYIMVDRFKYLPSELTYMASRLLEFIWGMFLVFVICYFDYAISRYMSDQDPKLAAGFTEEKIIRLAIGAMYMVFAAVFMIIEPIIKRVHQRLLESYYPEVAERRAKVLMMIIRLRRKSFIKINRLNIYLRFNKVGNLWTALRSFVEDSSLGDCLGRPSGLFCSICEKEANLQKNAKRCSTHSCPCVYCNECYEQIQFICLYCNKKYDESMVVHIHPNFGNNTDTG